MSLHDFRTDLADEMARAKSALSLTDRVAGFVAALDRAGFTVEAKMQRASGLCIEVTLVVDLPTDLIDAPAPAPAPATEAPALSMPAASPVVVESHKLAPVIAPAPEAPALSMPPASPVVVESHTLAPVIAPAPARKLSRNAPGPRWIEDENARLVAMIAGGKTAAQAAEDLGRPKDATAYRCKVVLKERIVAAKAAKAAPDAQIGPGSEAPCHGFTPDQDAALRRYMADDMGLGSSAKMLNMPRAKVAARWAELQMAGAA